MTQISLSLDEDLNAFVQSQVQTGKYESANDYFVSLLSRIKAGKQNLEALLLEGIESEGPKPLDDSVWQTIRAEVAERLSK